MATSSGAVSPEPTTDESVAALCRYLDASPTPFHACGQAAALLAEAGYTEVADTQRFPAAPGRYYLIRGGSLIAWNSGSITGQGVAKFRIVGAHTDRTVIAPALIAYSGGNGAFGSVYCVASSARYSRTGGR